MRYLTKSRYKLGLECPNKLYYTKKEAYANQKDDNPFLEALASGGFQVEELARLHYPDGVLINDTPGDRYDYDAKVAETNTYLEQDNVVIFEAAFKYNNLFIRVDILEKKGDQINLIEVKAKSFKKGHDKKDVKFNSNWNFYLFDVAFQKYVIEKARPSYKVSPYLMLADQDKTAQVDRLNQMFRIKKNKENRTGIETITEQVATLKLPEQSVLSLVPVSDLVAGIESGKHRILKDFAFEDSIAVLAKAYSEDRYIGHDLNFGECKKCEFRTDESTKDKKSGFKECFGKQMNWNEADFEDATVFEITKLHHTKLKMFNELGILKLQDIDDSRLMPKSDSKQVLNGWTLYERQVLQKEMALQDTALPYKLLRNELKAEMESWKFPLNFIDFEASTVALPFHKGQSPYEKVVFQFSHHIYHENGFVEHANQYINVEPGVFPNFEFVRALKSALSHNDGTVFQYSPYENSTLNQVKAQLEGSSEPDREQLINFIKSLTSPPKDRNYMGELWKPTRGMVDLCEVIKAYYYNAYTKGSNSIKDVLPAIFRTSPRIREKYARKIADINMTTSNFPIDHIWLDIEEGAVVDPYKKLDKPFEDWDENFERKSDIEEVNNGGAALTAYGLTQYTDMGEMERGKLKSALLKYCELDTLAMVMIFEHLKELTE
ncbi:DUF2779 domain-containing protein [Flagellimonas marinaquae]|uniref:DUF2779 domain-containing protein n=1 Tax=Flagellimonas marinaquae TaxID=254955 RepID=UPI000F8ED601|nr:DUF2779 domain-containing protein [Allomuricauda aquimarina]